MDHQVQKVQPETMPFSISIKSNPKKVIRVNEAFLVSLDQKEKEDLMDNLVMMGQKVILDQREMLDVLVYPALMVFLDEMDEMVSLV